MFDVGDRVEETGTGRVGTVTAVLLGLIIVLWDGEALPEEMDELDISLFTEDGGADGAEWSMNTSWGNS